MRFNNILAGAALAVGAVAVFSGVASAAPTPDPVPPSKDRVVKPANVDNLMQPEGNRGVAGARIKLAPRVGQAQNTAEFQVWTVRNLGGGKIAFIFQPSVAGGRQLCLDVQGDSRAEGAPLVLAACDFSPSQLWKRIGSGVGGSPIQNQDSKLYMEFEEQNGNRFVQRAFPKRPPSGAPLAENQAFNKRRNAQTLFVNPKTFGVGGA